MRSALYSSLCAAALCAVAASATAAGQAAPANFQTSMTSTLPVKTFAPSAEVAQTLVAEATAAPMFSSSIASPANTTDGTADLPDSPEANSPADGLGAGLQAQVSTQPIAPKYTFVILPGQGAVPLSAGDKVAFGLRQQVNPFTMLSRVLSATWSQAVDSQPHYGQGWGPYGQRVGASFARGAVQDLATMSVFDPIFHDDPRYYVMGRSHKLINRALYAASRVVITRTDSGGQAVNAPLLLGYAAAAGANMAYYPRQDRNFGDAALGYAGSLGGSVLGFEVNEFLDDALHLVHLRHN